MEMIENICPISERRYEELPVDKIKVINSRNRDKDQFEMNVESIDSVGLLKPIRVNDKFLEKSGVYELICGEGRLLAHRQLGRETVLAEVVTCTRKEALLQSLIENIARTKPGSMDFAREGIHRRATEARHCRDDSSENILRPRSEVERKPLHDLAQRDQHSVSRRDVGRLAANAEPR